MHTKVILGPGGHEARVHHNSDWSGDAWFSWNAGDGHTEVHIPGWIAKRIVDGKAALAQPKQRDGQPGRPASQEELGASKKEWLEAYRERDDDDACPYWSDGQHCYSDQGNFGGRAKTKVCGCGSTIERRT